MNSQDLLSHGAESNDDLQLLSLKFDTLDKLLEVLRAFYANKGYVLTIDSSKEKYVSLKCDRGGRYRDTHSVFSEKRRRNTTASRLMGCPFKIKGKKQEDGLWIVELKNCSHNHEPSVDISGHPLCRRLSPEDLATIEYMTNSGISPRQILSSMRQNNPDLAAVARTIYNGKVKIRKNNLAGRSMIQSLFEELGQNGFTYSFDKDKR